MYVYVQSESNLYTVGFYDPQGRWIPESDHSTKEEAANRVAWLNGSGKSDDKIISKMVEAVRKGVHP